MQPIDYTALEGSAPDEVARKLRDEAREGLWGPLARKWARGMFSMRYWRRFARLKAFSEANAFAAWPVADATELAAELPIGVVQFPFSRWSARGLRERHFRAGLVEYYDGGPIHFVEVRSEVPLPAVAIQTKAGARVGDGLAPVPPPGGGSWPAGVQVLASAPTESVQVLAAPAVIDAAVAAGVSVTTSGSAVYALSNMREMDDAEEWRLRFELVSAVAAALDAYDATVA